MLEYLKNFTPKPRQRGPTLPVLAALLAVSGTLVATLIDLGLLVQTAVARPPAESPQRQIADAVNKAATAKYFPKFPFASIADWPGWRGPKRDNVSLETGLLRSWPANGPPLVWAASDVNGKGCGAGYSSLSLVNNEIYTMGDRDKETLVLCYSAATGKELWAATLHQQLTGDGPRCTPTIDDDRVYALSRKGLLFCLDRQSGKEIWRKDFKSDFKGRIMSAWDYSESPLIDAGKLICAPGGEDAAIVALDKRTGEVIWKTAVEKCSGAGYSSIVPAEAGGIRQYITLLGAREGMVGVDAGTGKLLWTYKRIANGTANMITPIVHGDLVFVSSGYGVGTALVQLVPDGLGGIKVNEQYFLNAKDMCNMHGSMVLVDGYVYGGHGHNRGMPFCLELKTGKFAWGPVPDIGAGSATVLYADGRLYFRYQNNVLALVEASPGGFVQSGRFDLPPALGTGWQQTLIHNRRMYVRGKDQILCYDIRSR